VEIPDDFSSEEYEEMMDYMIKNNYIQSVGIDEDGEPIYKMTQDLIEDYPDIFEAHMEFTNELLFSVWQKGYVEMTMTEDGEWIIIPTDVTLNYEEIPNLTKEERLLLWELSEMKKRDDQ
jgi:hypothetical protein